MVYLVCEDSSSGSMFWEKVFSVFTDLDVVKMDDNTVYSNNVILLKSSKGNRGLWNTVKSLNLTCNDILILVYDDIPSQKLIAHLDAISDLQREIGFKYRGNSYYCIEKVFLSYLSLISFLNLTINSDRVNTLLKIRDFWLNNGKSEEAFKYSLKVFNDKLIEHHIDLGGTVEQQYAPLLSQLTSLSKLYVHIGKDYIGSCWLNDCIDGENKYVCKSCNKNELNLLAKDKLLSLERESILNDSSIHFEDFNSIVR